MSGNKVKSNIVKSTTTTSSSSSSSMTKIIKTASIRSYSSCESKFSMDGGSTIKKLSFSKTPFALDGTISGGISGATSGAISGAISGARLIQNRSDPFTMEFKTNQTYSTPKTLANNFPTNTDALTKRTPLAKYESPYRTTASFYRTPITRCNYDAKIGNNLLTSEQRFLKPYVDARQLAPPSISKTTLSAPALSQIPTTSKSTPIFKTTPITTTQKNYEKALEEKMENISLQSPKSKKFEPGVLYIFNNKRFDNPSTEERVGSECDVKLLENTFKKFRLSIKRCEDFTIREIRQQMNKILYKDFSKKSCIVIAIMSHGSRLETISAKDGYYSLDDDIVFPILRNKTLESKPKIFIVQACKGDIDLRHYKTDASLIKPIGQPTEIVKCYSTFEGYVSYRSSNGSVFITTMCELIQEYGNSKCIKDIMIMCIRKVKMLTNNNQIPTMSTTLTDSFVLGHSI